VKNARLLAFLTVAAALILVSPQCHAQAANSPVLQLDVWRRAVLSGDRSALAPLYTASPRILGPGQSPSNVNNELDYWTSWKARGLKTVSAEVNAQQEPQPGFHFLMIQLTLGVAENGATKKYYVKVGQGYIEQGATWKIAAEQRETETRLKAPAEKKDLYPAGVNAEKEIAEALQNAAKTHKRVLLIFGGNWCYDCHVLDEAFHTPEIAPTLNRNFVVVHVDVGEYDKNLDIAKKYEVPLERGVPAAAVLENDGKLLFTQKNQEFEKARSLAPEDVLAFLNKWKPAGLKYTRLTISNYRIETISGSIATCVAASPLIENSSPPASLKCKNRLIW
jgi:thioredoxin 1